MGSLDYLESVAVLQNIETNNIETGRGYWFVEPKENNCQNGEHSF